jgi:hypothetical protein
VVDAVIAAKRVVVALVVNVLPKVAPVAERLVVDALVAKKLVVVAVTAVKSVAVAEVVNVLPNVAPVADIPVEEELVIVEEVAKIF